jgi:hypothetical protein
MITSDDPPGDPDYRAIVTARTEPPFRDEVLLPAGPRHSYYHDCPGCRTQHTVSAWTTVTEYHLEAAAAGGRTRRLPFNWVPTSALIQTFMYPQRLTGSRSRGLASPARRPTRPFQRRSSCQCSGTVTQPGAAPGSHYQGSDMMLTAGPAGPDRGPASRLRLPDRPGPQAAGPRPALRLSITVQGCSARRRRTRRRPAGEFEPH